MRFLNDINATWKVNNSLTLITDANYIHDDGLHASGFGIVQWGVYKVNDWLKLVGRAEVWRDANNAFVAAFPGNFSFVNSEFGFPNNITILGPGPTTYLELTAGLNISAPIPDGAPLIKTLTVRPEVRYDSSLNGTTPFDGTGISTTGLPFSPTVFGVGTKSSQFTFGGDVVATF